MFFTHYYYFFQEEWISVSSISIQNFPLLNYYTLSVLLFHLSVIVFHKVACIWLIAWVSSSLISTAEKQEIWRWWMQEDLFMDLFIYGFVLLFKQIEKMCFLSFAFFVSQCGIWSCNSWKFMFFFLEWLCSFWKKYSVWCQHSYIYCRASSFLICEQDITFCKEHHSLL